MSARKLQLAFGLALALAGLAGGAAHATELTMQLDYSVAPSCPDPDVFRAIVSGRLGYNPFRADAPGRVLVRIESMGRALEGRLEWRDSAGERMGEHTFPSRTGDCGELARAMGFALALQVQLLATAAPEPPPPPPAPVPPPAAPPAAPVVAVAEIVTSHRAARSLVLRSRWGPGRRRDSGSRRASFPSGASSQRPGGRTSRSSLGASSRLHRRRVRPTGADSLSGRSWVPWRAAASSAPGASVWSRSSARSGWPDRASISPRPPRHRWPKLAFVLPRRTRSVVGSSSSPTPMASSG